MSHLMNTYARMPIAIVRGEGAWLWDEDGNRYLDAIAGIGVCGLGHSHPEITEVIADQAGQIIHTANLVQVPWQESLADRLAQVSGLDQAFIANSGAEAIECSLKLSRLYGHSRDIDYPKIIVAEHSFHGRTLAALSATGSRKVQAGYEPLVGGFLRVPFGDLDAIRKLTERDADIVAVLLEPIQGEAGVRVPPEGYLAGVREICDAHQLLMISDEIQTGLCRTGYWYACQHDKVLPDIIASAKALGNGIPIAACIATAEVAGLFSPGKHGSTFGGNPLACRVASTVLDIMSRDQLAAHASELGTTMLNGFKDRLARVPSVVDIRGRGLMLGIELDRPAAELKQRALGKGLLINVTSDNTIRLLPPIIIDQDQAAAIVDSVSELVEHF